MKTTKDCAEKQNGYILYEKRFGRQRLAFIDSPEEYGFDVFLKHGVKIKSIQRMEHPNIPCDIVFCCVKPKDVPKLDEIMEDLYRKAVLSDCKDFERWRTGLISFLFDLSNGIVPEEVCGLKVSVSQPT